MKREAQANEAKEHHRPSAGLRNGRWHYGRVGFSDQHVVAGFVTASLKQDEWIKPDYIGDPIGATDFVLVRKIYRIVPSRAFGRQTEVNEKQSEQAMGR